MKPQDKLNFKRITDAIEYLTQNFREQPNLDEVAQKVHLSSFHFQRLFTDWAGVSPKKFLQFLTIEYAKNILKESSQVYLMLLLKPGCPVPEGYMTSLLK